MHPQTHTCTHTSESPRRQVRALQSLEAALETLVRVHYAAGIGGPPGADAPRVSPAVLMGRLHRFLPPAPPELRLASDDEARGVRVYCATGIDQSLILHLLGVRRGCYAFQRFREWQQARHPVPGYLPAPSPSTLATVFTLSITLNLSNNAPHSLLILSHRIHMANTRP